MLNTKIKPDKLASRMEDSHKRGALSLMSAPNPINSNSLDFVLPPDLEAGEPPEARGLRRDEVRLMVSHGTEVVHANFKDLPEYLDPGDVLVVNTSGTMNASLHAERASGQEVEVHLSTHLPGGLWVIELRLLSNGVTEPFFRAETGETLSLAGGGTLTLRAPYGVVHGERVRLWTSTLSLPLPLDEYLSRYGSPIRYGYVKEGWPSDYYQTVYVTETGSAEMPSAGRAFTPELITGLIARGVHVAPLLLHTGVASLEEDEPPYEEYYLVPPETARLVNMAHTSGKRVVAVGTTVIRALETVTGEDGIVHPGEGWTDLYITPERGIRSVDGMLTGLHEPRSSHLAMLEALAGRELLRTAYTEALEEGYLWHEFGDLHLILPESAASKGSVM